MATTTHTVTLAAGSLHPVWLRGFLSLLQSIDGVEVVSLVAEFHLAVRWDVGCVVVSGFYGGHAELVACGRTGRASALQRAVLMAAYMQVVGAEEGGCV